jgi:AAA+ superfamily predicted ATPase
MKNTYLKIKKNSNLNGNYVNLPKTFLSNNLNDNMQTNHSKNKIIIIEVEILSLNKFFYFAYIGGISLEKESIEISSRFSEINNIYDEDYCNVKIYEEKIVELNLITIQPRFKEDYELIDDNADFFEEEFLNQLIVVYKGLKSYLLFLDKRFSEFEVLLDNEIISKQGTKVIPYILSQDCQVEVKGSSKLKNENSVKKDELTIHDIFANKFSFESCNFKFKLDNSKNNNLSSMTKTCLKYFPNQLKEILTSSIDTKSIIVNIKLRKKMRNIFKKMNKNSKKNPTSGSTKKINVQNLNNNNLNPVKDNLFRIFSNPDLITKLKSALKEEIDENGNRLNQFNNFVESDLFLNQYLDNFWLEIQFDNDNSDDYIDNYDAFSEITKKRSIHRNKFITSSSNDTNLIEIETFKESIILNTIFENNDDLDLTFFILGNEEYSRVFYNNEYIDFLNKNLVCQYYIFTKQDTSTNKYQIKDNLFPIHLCGIRNSLLNYNFIYHLSNDDIDLFFKVCFTTSEAFENFYVLCNKIGLNNLNDLNSESGFNMFVFFKAINDFESIKKEFNPNIFTGNVFKIYNNKNKLKIIDHRNVNLNSLIFQNYELEIYNNEVNKINRIYKLDHNSNINVIKIDNDKHKDVNLLQLNKKTELKSNCFILSHLNGFNSNHFAYQLKKNLEIENKITINHSYIIPLDSFEIIQKSEIALLIEYINSLCNYVLEVGIYNSYDLFIFYGLEKLELEINEHSNNSEKIMLHQELLNSILMFVSILNNFKKEKGLITLFCFNTTDISSVWNERFLFFFNNYEVGKIGLLEFGYLDKKFVYEIVLNKIKNEIKADESLSQNFCDSKINENMFRNFSQDDVVYVFKLIESFKKIDFDLDILINKIESYIPINISTEIKEKKSFSFDDIAGYNNSKSEIKEIINLYFNSHNLKLFGKIKLSSGLLLYGPSGCGKTYIASALAKELNVNFISVKGPELLNKYIGASEENVRKIFEKAKLSQPCIVFFDEFDSLGCVRGSGSTGVTDRIVNQLLTYLDGVESREGVFVVAASGKPDLIDSAILRPGRLETHILIDYPNDEDRLAILNYYFNCVHKNNKNPTTLKTKFDKETLEDFVNKTNFFNNAELQSLIYNAFLKNTKEIIEKNDINSEINIEKYHILESLSEIKIYDRERNKQIKNNNLKDVGTKQTYN